MVHFAPLAALALALAARVRAAIYVTNPVQSSTCAAGESCEVDWVDNGQSPLLSDIGECQVALYMGELQLVQSLPSVDVSTSMTFSFTPDPAAGPNGAYYIVFTQVSGNYQGFSASFTLTGMTGTTPSGVSSTSATTSATNSAGSSTSSGSSATGTATGTETASSASTLSGTTAITGTTPSTSGSLTTTPSSVSTVSSGTTTATTVRTSTTTSASASATATNAATRAGSSSSLGGIAALLVLSGVLAL